MGKEFYDKGSNLQLGPGLNVARVPLQLGLSQNSRSKSKCSGCWHVRSPMFVSFRNGRNFEYLSGAGLT